MLPETKEPVNPYGEALDKIQPIPWADFKEELLQMYQPPLRAHSTRRGMEHARTVPGHHGYHNDRRPHAAAHREPGRRTAGDEEPKQRCRAPPLRSSGLQLRGEAGVRLRISPFRVRGLSTYARRAPARGRKHASREEIRKVLDHMREQAQWDGWRGWKAKRLYALTATLAYTGMRAGEACFGCKSPTWTSPKASSGWCPEGSTGQRQRRRHNRCRCRLH